jgi:hypothetical protein
MLNFLLPIKQLKKATIIPHSASTSETVPPSQQNDYVSDEDVTHTLLQPLFTCILISIHHDPTLHPGIPSAYTPAPTNTKPFLTLSNYIVFLVAAISGTNNILLLQAKLLNF